jgi:hypothetical protein
MVSVRVRHDRPVDGLPRIHVEIAGFAIETARSLLEKGVAHAYPYGRTATGFLRARKGFACNIK